MVAAGLVQGTVRRQLVPAGQRQATPPEDLRRQVRNLADGTYIDDILLAQDSALYRWPDHLGDVIRVYVEPTSDIPGFDARYPQMAREVFAEWSVAGFPLRFAFIYDSTSADITVRVTERTQTSAFLIAKAAVSIANHDSTGRPLSVSAVGGILRHEIGHALGLNHASDPSSVMYRESATSTIGGSDRATLRLIYLVPAGSLK
jgi:predicted Zn-dependent protease